MKQKSLLLVIDRDGTLIINDNFPGKEANWVETLEINRSVAEFILYLQNSFYVTNIVVSNQSGVARGYFDVQTVQSINSHIDNMLRDFGIKIASWQFSPYVDKSYVMRYPQINFLGAYIKEKTKRKPSPEMVYDGLKELNKTIVDFDTVLVLGNRKDDSDLSDNLGAYFIDVAEKTSKQLIDILAVV